MSQRLTASKIGLAQRCAWWAREDVSLPPRASSAEAEAGTGIHAEIEHTLVTGDVTPKSQEHATWLANWWHEEKHHKWCPEVAFGLDLATGEAKVASARGREAYAELPAGWAKGTADVVAVVETGGERLVRIEDWKTGYQRHTEGPGDNPQLAFLALAAVRYYDADAALVAVVKLRAGDYDRREARLERLDLEVFREQHTELVAQIPESTPKPGPHCRTHFCAAFGTTCPATTARLPEVVPELAKTTRPVVLDWTKLQDNRHAAEMLALAYQMKKANEALWACVAGYAKAKGPIQLSGGRRWGFRATRTERVKSPMTADAIAAVRGVLGDAAWKALEMRTSKSALEAVAAEMARELKERGEKTTKKAIHDLTLEALRRADAIEVKEGEIMDEWVDAQEERA